MKVGSLFSGVGCGDLGLEWAGFEHAWFCEVNEYARQVLALRWPRAPLYEDILEVDFTKVEPVDLLAGGFPCQDISTAGKGAGIKGERSGLWNEFARAIGEIRPSYALIENSPALTARGLDVVLSDLAALRYDAEWHCLPASTFGAPHLRNRIWIVAYSQRLDRGREVLSKKTHRKDAERSPGGSSRSSGGSGKRDVANANSVRELQPERVEQKERGRPSNGGQEVFPNTQRLQWEQFWPFGRMGRSQQPVPWDGRGWWEVEPGLGRVADGTPHRVDRLKGIGNGQVPYCTCYLGHLIKVHAGAQGPTTFSKSAGNNE